MRSLSERVLQEAGYITTVFILHQSRLGNIPCDIMVILGGMRM